ncbi:MAG: 50S ribosomal protein L15 [Desulfocapsaceae bacterium]|nr:50S ribosomal protein L15 [Desulfocapsaceae bacterium]
MITLSNLSPNSGANKNKKRVGRGYGSGNGKTAGRGHKGARARSGFKSKPGFEGGQMPLQRRLPKIGFTNTFSKEFRLVSLAQLNSFDENTEITPEVLVNAGMAKKNQLIKVLANGEITKPLKLSIDGISSGARLKVESAGGSVELRKNAE